MRRYSIVLVAGICLPVVEAAPADLSSPAELARQISGRVEQIRGLEFRKPVHVAVVDAATAREHFRRRTDELWPESRAQLEQRVYADLGLLPPGSDLRLLLLDLLEEQAWGYYDPDSDTFFVLDDVPPASAPILMAHELTHALDDQHFQLDSRFEELVEDDDASTAFAAVVEGSGTAVMTIFMMEEIRAKRMAQNALEEIEQTEAGRAERLRAAPPLLRRGLLAPYTLGLSFLLRGDPERIRAGLVAEDVNRAFREPPVSSEQVIHPEKYWQQGGRDVPLPVPLEDQAEALGAGWRLVGEGRLGELNLALLAGADGPELGRAALSSEEWTHPAAIGVAGDVYHHYEKGARGLTILATLWDSDTEAREFAAALGDRPSFVRGAAVVTLAGDVDAKARALGRSIASALMISASRSADSE
jgi:hypothetical protein